MKIQYFPDTDSMMISLNDKPSHETVIINENINLDFDSNKNLVAIDIHAKASQFDLDNIEIDLPNFKQNKPN